MLILPEKGSAPAPPAKRFRTSTGLFNFATQVETVTVFDNEGNTYRVPLEDLVHNSNELRTMFSSGFEESITKELRLDLSPLATQMLLNFLVQDSLTPDFWLQADANVGIEIVPIALMYNLPSLIKTLFES